MIGRISKGRHAVVGVAIAGISVLAGAGVIGGGVHPERFDAKTLVVIPEGSGVRITEYVDIDFGTADRHGYERLIPNDFGVPSDVSASSPDASPQLSVADFGEHTRIRLGDPDRTFSGQHRYVLSYLLPDAHFDEIGFRVDLVSPPDGVFPGDDETGTFQVFVTGVELAEPMCDVGSLGAVGGCELTLVRTDPPLYRSILEPLAENDGLSIGGDIVAFAERVEIDPPPIPERRSEPDGALVALGMAALGGVGAVPMYRWARRKGRNEVFAGGAADAAYGALPTPSLDGSIPPPPPVRLVPDDEMGDLATIEFVPPKGVDPWEAQVLLREKLDHSTVEAWLSGLAGREAIEIDDEGDTLVIRSGPRRSELERDDAVLLDAILGIDDPYVTGEYDPKFATAWRQIQLAQIERIAATGWWRHMPPGAGLSPRRSGSPFGLLVVVAFVLAWTGSGLAALLGLLRSWPVAILLGVVFPATVAYVVYRVLLPARSALGSALALRTESFRRFLDASEAQHVEWAWSKGLLREYSAWAVALGEAEAWSKALAAANIPAAAAAAAGPMIIHQRGSSMQSSRTDPSTSSSSSGGGGFSGGGSVGGGGGGGSSGSW